MFHNNPDFHFTLFGPIPLNNGMDIAHTYGTDLQIAPPGDYSTVSDPTTIANQVLARFILTNPGDDIFNPAFGLGAKKIIGKANAIELIKAVVKDGLSTLDIVDHSQTVQVGAFYDPTNYSLNVSVQYVVAGTQNYTTAVVTVE